MRILITTFYSYPQNGGLGSYIRQLAQALEKRGNQVDILAARPDFRGYYLSKMDKFVETARIRNVVLSMYPDLEPLKEKNPWCAERELERYCFELTAAYFGIDKYDLIHTQDPISTRSMARLNRKHIPVVQTIHGSLTHDFCLLHDEESRQAEVYEYLRSIEYNGIISSTVTVVPSYWLKNEIVKHSGAPSERFTVIPNGLDITSFRHHPASAQNVVRPHAKYILTCVARLTEIKGHRYLLAALKRLKQDRQDWICWLIGEGELKAELEQLCAEAQLQNHVLLLGARDNVQSWLQHTDVFVLPSLSENCPYAIMEAQICGVPVVASNVGGVPEIVEHEVTGILTPARDPAALYRSIKRLLEDSSLRERIRNNLTSSWKKWSTDTMMKSILSVYEAQCKALP